MNEFENAFMMARKNRQYEEIAERLIGTLRKQMGDTFDGIKLDDIKPTPETMKIYKTFEFTEDSLEYELACQMREIVCSASVPEAENFIDVINSLYPGLGLRISFCVRDKEYSEKGATITLFWNLFIPSEYVNNYEEFERINNIKKEESMNHNRKSFLKQQFTFIKKEAIDTITKYCSNSDDTEIIFNYEFEKVEDFSYMIYLESFHQELYKNLLKDAGFNLQVLEFNEVSRIAKIKVSW